jgi:hypothetical protein
LHLPSFFVGQLYVTGASRISLACNTAVVEADAEFQLMDNWVRRLVALEEEARGFM